MTLLQTLQQQLQDINTQVGQANQLTRPALLKEQERLTHLIALAQANPNADATATISKGWITFKNDITNTILRYIKIDTINVLIKQTTPQHGVISIGYGTNSSEVFNVPLTDLDSIVQWIIDLTEGKTEQPKHFVHYTGLNGWTIEPEDERSK